MASYINFCVFIHNFPSQEKGQPQRGATTRGGQPQGIAPTLTVHCRGNPLWLPITTV